MEWAKEGRKEERKKRVGGGGRAKGGKEKGGLSFFSISKGAAFPKVPGATLQHLGSPRPMSCLLIANPHLCHMAR